jgi:DNA-binding Lrp family transcriptional regulator
MAKKFSLSQKDKKNLLNLLQQEFPIEEKPFETLAKKFDFSQEEIIEFLKNLQKEGIIRHFGATVNSIKLGYYTCLCGTSIPEERINIVYEIAELPEVTHAYLREHKLNFWFTVVLPSEETLPNFIKNLSDKYQIEIKSFPMVKKFKAKAVFTL